MKSRTIIACAIVLFLAVLFTILLILFLSGNKENKALYEEQKIIITVNGETKTYTYDELASLCPPVDFEAVYKPNNKKPVTKTYTGIELRLLIQAISIDTNAIKRITFTASDGFQKVYSAEDVQRENNVYIANKVNGSPFNKGIDALAYTKDQEDGGPYVVIKAEDKVSQNRVKMLVEIMVE